VSDQQHKLDFNMNSTEHIVLFSSVLWSEIEISSETAVTFRRIRASQARIKVRVTHRHHTTTVGLSDPDLSPLHTMLNCLFRFYRASAS